MDTRTTHHKLFGKLICKIQQDKKELTIFFGVLSILSDAVLNDGTFGTNYKCVCFDRSPMVVFQISHI